MRAACSLQCAAVAALVIGLSACASAPKRTRVMEQLPNLAADAQELRFRAYALADELSGLVEAASNEIIAGTTNPDIRFNALLWKANGVPVIRTASFQRDPVAAGLDVWALAVQMNDFFERGAGRTAFGDLQPIAIEASRQMVSRTLDFAAATANEQGVKNGAQVVREWADAHPLEDLLFTRTSIAELWANVADERARGLAAIADINSQVADLLHRLTIYSALLPKEARWQAELLLNEVKTDATSQTLLEDVASLEAEIAAIGDEVVTLEGHIGEASRALVEAEELLTTQRLAAVQALQAELAGLVARVTEERLALMSQVTGERNAILAGIREERIAALEAVTAERMAVMADIDELSRRLTDDGRTVAMAAVDRFFLRTVQLLIVVTVLAAVVGFVLKRRRRA